MNILISACLLGVKCRYNGFGIQITEDIKCLLQKHHFIPVCPEQIGGLCTPRQSVELRNGRAVTLDNRDVTAQFIKGAEGVLMLASLYKCSSAILKERSPSCGSSYIYDGTFSNNVIRGEGITAECLRKSGISVCNENDVHRFLE